MGKVIICVGEYAKNPFYFKLTGIHVYSIEELCYYIYNNIYTITEEFFTNELLKWIKEELILPDTAQKLEILEERKVKLRDKIITLFHSNNYYTEEEITILIEVIDKIENLTPLKKQEIRANNYLKYHNYKEAARLYKNILSDLEAASLTSDEYGNILHNLAVAHIYTNSYHEAAAELKEAYQRNRRKETLIQYFYALYFAGYKEAFYEQAKEYELSQQDIETLIKNIKEKIEKAKESDFYHKIEALLTMKEEGRMEEYYYNIDNFILKWKQEYKDIFQEY